MSVRRRFLFGLCAGAVLVACLYLLARDRSAITAENYGKIRTGMTLAEVETVLGGPAGNYGYHGQGIVQTQDEIDVPRLAQGRYVQWLGPTHMVGIQFDGDDRVVGKDLGKNKPLPIWRLPLSLFRL